MFGGCEPQVRKFEPRRPTLHTAHGTRHTGCEMRNRLSFSQPLTKGARWCRFGKGGGRGTPLQLVVDRCELVEHGAGGGRRENGTPGHVNFDVHAGQLLLHPIKLNAHELDIDAPVRQGSHMSAMVGCVWTLVT